MATIRKLSSGRWNVEIRRKGFKPIYGTFDTKRKAELFACEQEAGLGNNPDILKTKTLGDAMRRYALEVSTTKKGERWETIRINAMLNHPVIRIALHRITTEQMQAWINERRAQVSNATVKRELNLLSAIINTARREWKWCDANPITDARKPKAAAPRDRRLYPHEQTAILQALDYEEDAPATSNRQRLAIGMLISLETAMRQGELWGLEWNDVNFVECYAVLNDTKNGTKRYVPLSNIAITLFEKLRNHKGGRIMDCSQASAGVIFKRACVLAGVKDFRWHDLRHEAITRLASKLNMLELARMVGHKDPRNLMIYYNATPSDLAKRLNL